jgi:hypothetical protein
VGLVVARSIELSAGGTAPATILTRGLARNEGTRSPLTLLMQNWEIEKMADRELIAAILTAGMLPTVEIPRSRLDHGRRPVPRAEAEAIERAIDHAFGLYRLVLNGLGVDPLSTAETGAQPQASANMTDQRSHSHRETGALWEHARSAFDPS